MILDDKDRGDTKATFSIDVTPPRPLTEDEYNACYDAILKNIQNGNLDPLLGLSEDTETRLRDLAETDMMRLDRMERKLQSALRDSNVGEEEARKFKLTTFRKAAVQHKRAREAEIRRVQAMRARGLKVLKGGLKDERLERLEEINKSGSNDAAVLMDSPSPFHKAVGMLQDRVRGRIWYDDFLRNFYTDWDGDDVEKVIKPVAVTEAWELHLYNWLMLQDIQMAKSLSQSAARAALHEFGYADRRNQPQEWLRGLEWDKTPRLDHWLHTVYGTPVNDYHTAIGRAWMISMVARVMRPGCKVDTMPVLQGPQGGGKSTSLAILGGDWYRNILVTVDKTQDFIMSLQGVLVAEVGELDAIRNRATSRVKNLLSNGVDQIRMPYGHNLESFPRTVVPVGTTNDPDWHQDETGGRRFWAIECVGKIDLEWLRANRGQLFAEAYHAYQAGEPWWLNKAMEAEANDRAMEHLAEEPWVDIIAAWIEAERVQRSIYDGLDSRVKASFGDPTKLEMIAKYGTVVTTHRIASCALQIPADRDTRVTHVKIAQCLRTLGWVKAVVRGQGPSGTVLHKAWVLPDATGQLDIVTKQ